MVPIVFGCRRKRFVSDKMTSAALSLSVLFPCAGRSLPGGGSFGDAGFLPEDVCRDFNGPEFVPMPWRAYD